MMIQYSEPLSRGFARMKKALFNPVDVKKWFVVGFTAFLSGLMDCHGNGGGGAKSRGSVDWVDVLYFPQRAWEWLADNPLWAMVIVVGAVLLFLFGILVTWWGSRGKFMFLDNVVHDRAHVIAPWHEYRMEGNSLFLLVLLLGLVVFALVIAYVVQCITALQTLYENSDHIGALLGPAILMVLGLFAILVVNGVIDLLLYDFVVPIMYRDRSSALKAIQKFVPLLRSHAIYFFGYAVFMFFIFIVLFVCILLAGFATCCIGFVLLALPYINAVFLLPISYTLRAFSVEFLEQFGPEYHVFPRPASTPQETGPVVA